MAATDTLDSFIKSLSQTGKDILAELIRNVRDEMFAARSEEARVRIAHEFIVEAHERLSGK